MNAEDIKKAMFDVVNLLAYSDKKEGETIDEGRLRLITEIRAIPNYDEGMLSLIAHLTETVARHTGVSFDYVLRSFAVAHTLEEELVKSFPKFVKSLEKSYNDKYKNLPGQYL